MSTFWTPEVVHGVVQGWNTKAIKKPIPLETIKHHEMQISLFFSTNAQALQVVSVVEKNFILWKMFFRVVILKTCEVVHVLKTHISECSELCEKVPNK